MSQYEDHAQPQRGSNNTVLYIILAVVLVIFLICGGIAFMIYRAVTGVVDTVVEGAHQGMVQAIRQSDMDDDDKDKIIAQVNRVAESYKAGDITTQQVTEIMGKVFQPPIVMVGMCQYLEKKYVPPSDLTDEEKEAGHVTLQRLARGAHEGKITQGQFETVTGPIKQMDQNGSESLKPTLTDDELREFLADAKQLADDSEIPDEPYDIDLGNEVKKAVDAVLGEE